MNQKMKLWDASLEGQECPRCKGTGWVFTEGDLHRSPGSIPCPGRHHEEGIPYCANGRLKFTEEDRREMKVRKAREAKPPRYEGAYVLRLYCDSHAHWEEFRGRTFQSCANAAKRAGWRLHEERRTATCRDCHREAKRSKPKFVVEIKRRRR